jgi:hypothetical protein
MQGPKKSRDKQARELRAKIVERTGISNAKALEIAQDAVRGRNLSALARQKGWPVDWDRIVGPSGELPLALLGA